MEDAKKLELVWEWFNNKSNTTQNKQHYEETIPRSSEVHGSEVFGELIPSTPPATTHGIVKKFWAEELGGDGLLAMTVDRSVGGNITWVAHPIHQPNWSSGSADTSLLLKNFISPKYGKNYLVKVFDGQGKEIPQLDDSKWLFDYNSGILTFNGVSSRSEAGTTPENSIKIAVYQYIGQSVLDIISQGGSAPVDGLPETSPNTTLAVAEVEGVYDSSNLLYTLPAAVKENVYHELKVAGVKISPRDYSITQEVYLEMSVALADKQKLEITYWV